MVRYFCRPSALLDFRDVHACSGISALGQAVIRILLPQPEHICNEGQQTGLDTPYNAYGLVGMRRLNNPAKIKSFGVTLKLDYELTNHTITTITSYQDIYDRFARGDIDGGYGCPLPVGVWRRGRMELSARPAPLSARSTHLLL